MADDKKARPDTKQKGYVGTVITGGRIYKEEYNLTLANERALPVYDKMYRTDAQVKATALAIMLPILAAEWDIQPASQDEADKKISDFVRENFFENPNFTWNSLLRQILKYPIYGFYCFEKIPMIKNGKVYYRKIEARLPKTIQKWNADKETGNLASVQQWVYNGTNYVDPVIPAEYLLLFVNDQEGQNWRGTSFLRSAYRNFFIKEKLLKIDAIKHERFGVGLPVIELPEAPQQDDEERAKTIGETFRAHENAYMVVPHGFKVSSFEVSGKSNIDVTRSIQMHNEEISSNILSQFMDLGKTSSGSRALGGTLRDMFLLSLQSFAQNIEDEINEGSEGRQCIKQLVDWNFSGVKKYPKLRASKIANIDFGQVSASLSALAGAQLISPDDELERWIRKTFDLPEVSEEDAKEKRKAKDFHDSSIHIHEFSGDWSEGEPFSRELTPLEKSINMKEIESKIRTANNDIIKMADDFRGEIITKLVNKNMGLLTKKMSFENFSASLDKVKLPLSGALENKLRKSLVEVFDYSKNKVRDELTNKKKYIDSVIEDQDETKKAVRTLATIAVGTLAVKLLTEWKREMLRQRMAGTVDSEGLVASLATLTSGDWKREVRGRVMESFGLARNSEAKKYADQIDYVIRSEVMDSNTCNPCAKVDGKKFTLNSPEARDFLRGPYVHCKGRENCRGINIYVRKDEE